MPSNQRDDDRKSSENVVHRYVLFHKPYGVLSKFTDSEGRPTLADYITIPDVYSVGRLDKDSEGLLLLTSDGAFSHHLTSPSSKVPKTYWVQVERVPIESALERLRNGVIIQGKRSRPARVTLLKAEPQISPRSVPIRFRKSVPTAWLKIEISEGMNRQIRRMTAQIGHPTLRLIRVAIGTILLGDLPSGHWRELKRPELEALWP
ncbi:MAG: pseudouridine synthase [Nitrospirales bacterium]|nr:pseudouridine synthase [Nitrospirales bacterium]